MEIVGFQQLNKCKIYIPVIFAVIAMFSAANTNDDAENECDHN